MIRAALRCLVLLALVASLVPSFASARTVSQELIVNKGSTAIAQFLREEGCLVTEVVVFATESVSRAGANQTDAFGQAVILTTDTCTGATNTLFGFIDTLNIDVAHGNAGVVSGPVLFTSFETGEVFEGFVSLELTGVGSAQHGHGQFLHRFPGGMLQFHQNGFFRDAIASGSITVGGVDVLAGAAGTGVLEQITSGQLTLTRETN